MKIKVTSIYVEREYDRLKPLGTEFTMPPTKVTGSTIAMLKIPAETRSKSLRSTGRAWQLSMPGVRMTKRGYLEEECPTQAKLLTK